MSDTTIIIIGAGVIGLSTAYQLAKNDTGHIILLEKTAVGDGASSRAAGIITGLLWSETGVVARRISLSLFRELSEELDGYHFNDVGCLNVFDTETWVEREKLLALYDRLDFKYEILEDQEIKSRWHDLNPDENTVGLFDPLGGYSEPHEYIPALKQGCLDLGVDIREGCQVNGFLKHRGSISGVITQHDGHIGADVVISTVHVWTHKLLESINYQLPMKAFVHQRYLTKEMDTTLNLPAINANPQGGYIRPARLGRDNNRLLAGFETEHREELRLDALDFNMTELETPASVRQQMTRNLRPLIPCLAKTTWDRETLGLISFSMDGEPILGAVDDVDGLYIATAFHSGGFAYSPVVGKLMAELVTTGHTSIDISAFSPQRFKEEDVDAYLGQSVTQASAVKRRH